MKETTFFKGDPAMAKFLRRGDIESPDFKLLSKEQKTFWLNERDKARKNPPAYALVRNTKVYNKKK